MLIVLVSKTGASKMIGFSFETSIPCAFKASLALANDALAKSTL
jgi:hypothetical protein